MKTKNIFKTLVLAAVLVSACGKNEIANEENTEKKGFSFPVTVNVTREGDDATKATYNETSKKLEFSAGDKLFVMGYHDDADQFAGTLDYDAVSGKFSGTVTTQKEYTGTIDGLMTSVYAFLLPAGYGSYGFFSIVGSGYGASVNFDLKKAFALTKAAAVEQFSVEYTNSYSSGFALAPMSAIASFTISGLTANKEVAVSFDTGGIVTSGNVTTNATGVATFAIGVSPGNKLENCTLTVDGNNIAMPTKQVEPGHIYNISRSVAPATPTLTLTSPTVGQVIGSDGKNYAAGASLPTGVTKVAMIAYVNGSNGLAIALADESGYMNWATAKSTCEAKTPAFTGGTWKLPSLDEWKNMLTYDGDLDSYMNNNLQTALSTAGGNSLQEWIYYWSSTDYDSNNTEACDVEFQMGGANFSHESKTYTSGMAVRAVLAF